MAHALPGRVELAPAGHAVDVGGDGLAGQGLELVPGEGERRVDLAPDPEVPGGQVGVRHRAVMQDRELVGPVLARRDAAGERRILVAIAEETFEHREPRAWRAVSSHRTGVVPVRRHRRRRPVAGLRLPAWIRQRPCRGDEPDRRPASRPPPRLIIVMPAYNAARTLQRTYADIPHELVHEIILVDDVSADETVEIAGQLGLVVIIHPAEPRLRRQPEDLLRRGAGGRRRHRGHAPPRLPVRRHADPGPDRADRRRLARPDAGQPVPGRSRWPAACPAGSTSATAS